MSIQVSTVATDKLRSALRGEVIRPGDATYDEARKIWNGDIDRRPALIARCTNVEDVKAALAFGIESGLRIAVKGGGHSLPGHSVADGALMIDLRPMNKVTVDTAARRAAPRSRAERYGPKWTDRPRP